MALVKYYYDPSEPNGDYDENTLAGCVGGGEGYEKVDTNSSDDIYLCIDGIPAGATITNISASFTCKNLTWMNEDWAVIIKYKTTATCIPVILQNPSFSGNKITSLGSVSTFGNSTTLCSNSHLFNTTSKSINQSGNKSLPI